MIDIDVKEIRNGAKNAKVQLNEEQREGAGTKQSIDHAQIAQL